MPTVPAHGPIEEQATGISTWPSLSYSSAFAREANVSAGAIPSGVIFRETSPVEDPVVSVRSIEATWCPVSRTGRFPGPNPPERNDMLMGVTLGKPYLATTGQFWNGSSSGPTARCQSGARRPLGPSVNVLVTCLVPQSRGGGCCWLAPPLPLSQLLWPELVVPSR